MSAVNSGAYFCPGAAVTVVAVQGDWRGQIVSMGATSGAAVVVGVLDPGGNPLVRHGQRVTLHWTDLRLPPKVVSWR